MIDCGAFDDELDDEVAGVAELFAFEFDVDEFEEDDGGVDDSFDEFDDDDVDDEDDDDAAPVLLVPVVSIISTLVSFKVCCSSCCVIISFVVVDCGVFVSLIVRSMRRIFFLSFFHLFLFDYIFAC